MKEASSIAIHTQIEGLLAVGFARAVAFEPWVWGSLSALVPGDRFPLAGGFIPPMPPTPGPPDTCKKTNFQGFHGRISPWDSDPNGKAV